MRKQTKPSTAKCNLGMYTSYLLSEPGYTSCTRLAEIEGKISHDSVNRFLERENYTAQDAFEEIKEQLVLEGGVVSIDDTVLDKPYSDPTKAQLIDYFWSGKHKRVVKGINLVTLYHTDVNRTCVPINYRVYNKEEGKTKNDYFREMIKEVMAWGVKPTWVTGDSWYSSLENLKFLRKQGLYFLFGVDSNRLISVEKGRYIQVQSLADWPESGKIVYLKEFGNVKIFRQLYKKVYRYYLIGVPDLETLPNIQQSDFSRNHAYHWQIECFHRAVKQTCNIERFQVRSYRATMNHLFCAIRAFIKLELLRVKRMVSNWYQIKRDLFVEVIRRFIFQDGPALFQQSDFSYSVNA